MAAVDSFSVRFGRRLRQLRLQRGLSQKMLAKRVALDLTTLSNIECGRYNPSFNRLEDFADALEVELAELFEFNR